MKVWALTYPTSANSYLALFNTEAAALKRSEKNRGEMRGLAVHYPLVREIEVEEEA